MSHEYHCINTLMQLYNKQKFVFQPSILDCKKEKNIDLPLMIVTGEG
jgi:hypothetical protein